MDKRRKALGLRKRNDQLEDNIKNTGDYNKKSKFVKEGKKDQSKSLLTNQCTPKRHNEVSTLKDSPCSPLQSPGLQPIFPRTLGSPEIEVSWDWGCSQVVKDVAPTKQLKHKIQQQPSSPLVKDDLSSLTHCPRLLHHQMSEQENQERLAFYKNVLSQSSKGNLQLLDDSKSNNISEEPCYDSTKDSDTPKRAPKLEVNKSNEINAFFDDSANEFMLECSQAIEEQLKNGQITTTPVVNIQGHKHAHSPVIDEGNSLKRMCHGKTKQNLFPDIPSLDESPTGDGRKLRLRSPRNKLAKRNPTLDKLIVPSESTLKEYEESDVSNDMLFLRPTQNNSSSNFKKKITNDRKCSVPTFNNDESVLKDINLCNNGSQLQNKINNQCILEDKILSAPVSNSVTSIQQKSMYHSKPTITKCQTVNNNVIKSGNPISTGQSYGNTGNISRPLHYDSVDKFRRVSKGNITINNNQVSTNSKMGARPVVNSVTQVNLSRTDSYCENQQKSNDPANVPVSKANNTDVASLLDDDFDVELSSLDFESLVCNSQNKEVPEKPVTQTAPKICTRQEIEAKRIAALNRLRLKKRM